MAVLYQSDDMFATGLHDSAAAAISLEPALNVSLSVGISSNIRASAASAAHYLKSSGYRYALPPLPAASTVSCLHCQLPDPLRRSYALFMNTDQALSHICPALVEEVNVSCMYTPTIRG